MTPKQLVEMKALNENRTQGEWVYRHLTIHADIRRKDDNAPDAWNEVHRVDDEPYKSICSFASTRGGYWQEEANGRFVAEMANHAADLLAAAERAERLQWERDEFAKALFSRSRRQMLGVFPNAYADEELAKMFAPWWERHDTAGLSPREVRLLETVADRNLQLAKSVITCAFCGQHYKSEGNDPAELAEHVKVCEKHPMAAMIRDRDEARQRAERAEAELERLRKLLGMAKNHMHGDNWACNNVMEQIAAALSPAPAATGPCAKCGSPDSHFVADPIGPAPGRFTCQSAPSPDAGGAA